MIKKISIWFLFLSILFAQLLNADEKFLSLKKDKVNVRYGHGFDHPIKYIYRKKNLPVKQIDKKENWRRIIDLKNNSGWIHWSQLKPINSFINLDEKILFQKPSNFSKPLARIQKGRVLIIQKCIEGWCKIKSDKFRGWIKTDNIWGSIK